MQSPLSHFLPISYNYWDMPFTNIFFDLDDTLYPNDNGLWKAIRDRMTDFMHQRLRLTLEDVSRLRREYYETYGTTLRGLQEHHGVDPDEFLAFVHELPLEAYLEPDPNVRALLRDLPQDRWIFTNSDTNHARRVLAVLNLSDCFNGIIDIHAMEFHPKPSMKAYEKALTLVGENDPSRCVMLDDLPRNLAPAKERGFITVLVGSTTSHPAAHHVVAHLHELPKVLPELWSD